MIPRIAIFAKFRRKHPQATSRPKSRAAKDLEASSHSKLVKILLEENTEPQHELLSTPAWKRVSDIFLIVLASPVLLLLFAAISIWIRSVSKGSIFFRQSRVGRDGKLINIYKFRTMHPDSKKNVHERYVQRLADLDRPMIKLDTLGDPRLIKGGFLLRASGLDELPQLINVLIGNMSLVGPRPCLPTEYDLYSKEQRERFATVPGLTGFWQINGKNSVTFKEMVEMDICYVRSRALWVDFIILAVTPAALLVQTVDSHLRGRQARRVDKPSFGEEFAKTITSFIGTKSEKEVEL